MLSHVKLSHKFFFLVKMVTGLVIADTLKIMGRDFCVILGAWVSSAAPQMPSAVKGQELGRTQRGGTLFPVAFGKAVGYSCQESCLGLREEHTRATGNGN